MANLKKLLTIIMVMLALATVFSGCKPSAKPSAKQNTAAQQPQTLATGSAANEQPAAPEVNPIGDIPDNQVFVTFSSPAGGYQIQAPEGWARTASGTDVAFVDKYDGVSVAIAKTAPSSSLEQVRGDQLAALQKSVKAVQVKRVTNVQIAGGPAALLVYDSNSAPDPVTNKEVRLENNRYLIEKNGKLAIVTLWAPLGADNVDQWNLISDSFRWQ